MTHDYCNYVGAAGEAAVASELTRAGFHVYAPVFCNPDTDLIAERNGCVLRVQVKTLAGDAPALRFIAQTASVSSYIGLADWFAFHSLHHGVTAYMKPEEAGTRPTIRYADSTTSGGKPQRRVEDYTIERVIKETDL